MAIVNLIKSFSERPAEAKETPYTPLTPLYKKIKIKFVRYRKVLAPPQRRRANNYHIVTFPTLEGYCYRKINSLFFQQSLLLFLAIPPQMIRH